MDHYHDPADLKLLSQVNDDHAAERNKSFYNVR